MMVACRTRTEKGHHFITFEDDDWRKVITCGKKVDTIIYRAPGDTNLSYPTATSLSIMPVYSFILYTVS